jgi:DUF1680 family protein
MNEQLGAFSLSAVRLLPGPIRDRQTLNTRYLLELEPDRLLHNFRVQANLPSSAQPLGGWEAPACGLRGHFVGHYLSACAQGYAATDDNALRERALVMVDGLRACQDALGSGYLSAFPESDLEAIETRFTGAWASYYVLHKILAGLIDVHRYVRDEAALPIARQLADYLCRRIERLSPAQIEGMCRTDLRPNPTNEFGGIGETLQDLADLTGERSYNDAARIFDRDWFIDPLARGEDRLSGLHANTHIPMALALARRYERTGEERLRAVVEYFWERTAVARSYVNGGSSGPRPDGNEKSTGGEHWPEPFQLAGTLTPKINESCVTHNMLRLTDMLFRWTADRRYADFYLRAYFNHLLAMQHPQATGRYLYDHPLGPVSRKKFGHACDAFWCCYGSTIEAYERLGQGIYYHRGDGLWVNLPVASVVEWSEKGVRLEQRTHFPYENVTRLTVRCLHPVQFTIHTPWAHPECRTWHDGDVLTLTIPMPLQWESMPDDPGTAALLCGPIVLAGRTDQPLEMHATASLTPMNGPMRFAAQLADGRHVEFVPLAGIVDEPFTVYVHLSRA